MGLDSISPTTAGYATPAMIDARVAQALSDYTGEDLADVLEDYPTNTGLRTVPISVSDRFPGASPTDIRELATRYVTPRMCGLVGDGVADDAAAFKRGMEMGSLQGDPTHVYRIDSDISISNKSAVFDGNGAKVHITGDAKISFKVSLTNVQNITAIDNTATYDWSGDTVTPRPMDVTRLYVPSTAGYAVDDLVKIVADDLIPGENPADNLKLGEFATVGAVEAGALVLRSRLRDNYVTNPRVARVPRDYTCELRNFRLQGPSAPLASWTKTAIEIIGYVQPVVEQVQAFDLVDRAVRFLSCWMPQTDGLSGRTIRSSVANDAFGYLVHESACEGGLHIGLRGYNLRHLYTCSATSAPTLSPNIENYGKTRGTLILGGRGRNCQAAPFSTHADGEGITFAHCYGEAPFNGVDGDQRVFAIRGRNNRVDSCIAKGGDGFVVFADVAHPDCTRDVEIANCLYIGNPNQAPNSAVDRRAFSVVGLAGGLVTGVRIVNPKVQTESGDNPDFETFYGEMTVVSPYVRAKKTGTNTARVFEANTQSTIRVEGGGTIDLTGSTSTATRIARVLSSSGAVYFGRSPGDAPRIVAQGGTVQSIATLNGVAGTFVGFADLASGLNVSAGLESHTASGATAWLDYAINQGRGGTARAALNVATAATGSLAVDLANRAAPKIFLDVDTAHAGVELNSLTSGYNLGQELVVRNKSALGNSLTIKHALAGKIDLTTDVLLAPGRAFRLRWHSGGNWVAA
jgi:hypothetical protein